MRAFILGSATLLAGSLISMADPIAACTNLVGTYAEPKAPEKPLLTVAFTNGQFTVADATGNKTIMSTTPTEKGLVFVEDPRDRNVFRLSSSAKPGVYLFEYLGDQKDGVPLPEKPARSREMVRVQPERTNSGNK
jgi:hypothetical protein